MKKILICGGTGFIGRNMVNYYSKKEGYKVFATYYKSEPYQCDGVTFIKADLTDQNEVNKLLGGVDIVIQAAATTSGVNEILNKPYYHVTDNAVMNSLVLRSAFENKIEHLIFFSCTVMYQPGEIPVKETDFNADDELFPSYFGVGWTKIYIEKMCEFYSRICDTRFTAIRHSNIYGPHDKYDLERSHVFGATITKVMKAKDGGQISIWGEGKEKRDLLYIDDLVLAVDSCIERQETKYELINVGRGKAISISDLVKMVISIAGKKIEIEYDVSKPTIPTELSLDCTKAQNLLDWVPGTSLEEGIKRTIEWYKNNISAKDGGLDEY